MSRSLSNERERKEYPAAARNHGAGLQVTEDVKKEYLKVIQIHMNVQSTNTNNIIKNIF